MILREIIRIISSSLKTVYICTSVHSGINYINFQFLKRYFKV